MIKQDVRIEYQNFKNILELIIKRLRNNAIVTTDKNHQEYATDDLEYYSYQFLLPKEQISLEENIILKALDFLSGKNYIFYGKDILEDAKLFTLLDFEDLEKEYSIIITDKRGILILHHLYDYIRSIYQDKEKQDIIMEFINKPNLNLSKPRFGELHFLTYNEPIDKDHEDYGYITKIKQWKDFLVECSFIFDGNRRYPLIVNNSDYYYKKEEMKNNIIIYSKEEENTVILKKNIKSRCKELMKNHIKEYLNKEGYNTGGFKTILFNDIKILLKKEFPVIIETNKMLFSKNLFDTAWKEIIKENPKYECLSKHGRRY